MEFTATFRYCFCVTVLSSFYLLLPQKGMAYSRLTLKKVLKADSKGKQGMRSLLLRTGESEMDSVIRNLDENNYEKLRIAGLVIMDRDLRDQTFQGMKIVAGLEDVYDYICREWVDEVFADAPEDMPFFDEIINNLTEMGVAVHIRLAKAAKLTGQKQYIEK